MSIATTKEDIIKIMDEFYFLYYEQGQIVRELDDPSEAPIVLSAVKYMLEHVGDDGEPMYKIKQRMIIEDLKVVIPPNDYPDLWI